MALTRAGAESGEAKQFKINCEDEAPQYFGFYKSLFDEFVPQIREKMQSQGFWFFALKSFFALCFTKALVWFKT